MHPQLSNICIRPDFAKGLAFKWQAIFPYLRMTWLSPVLQARQAWEADGQTAGSPSVGAPGSTLQVSLTVADPPAGWDVLLQMPAESHARPTICWQSKSDRHQKRCWGQVSHSEKHLSCRVVSHLALKDSAVLPACQLNSC